MSSETNQQDKHSITTGLSSKQKLRLAIGVFGVFVFLALYAVYAFQQYQNQAVAKAAPIKSPEEKRLVTDPETNKLTQKMGDSQTAVNQENVALRADIERLKLNNQEKTSTSSNPTVKSVDSPGVSGGARAVTPTREVQKLGDKFQDGVKGKLNFPKGTIDPKDFKHHFAALTEQDQAQKGGGNAGQKTEQKPASSPESEWGGAWLTVLAEPSGAKAEPKKKGKKIKLPAGMWTTGVVLAGTYAPVMAKALSEAEPIAIRIETEAVLPNEGARNISGCMVLGAANGNMGIHRGSIWLTKISCTSRKGRALISEKIDGWVTDSDGRSGIAGKVYAYYDETIGYTAVAEGAKAAGEILKQQTMTQNLIPTTGGQVNTMNPGQIGQATGGGVVSGAATAVGDIYASLTKQQMPYVDISPGKRVTIFLKSEVTLELKNVCEGEEEECNDDEL
jgi:conjugal transfer pilus assembly protein TraB